MSKQKIKIIIFDDEMHILNEIYKTIKGVFDNELKEYEPEIIQSRLPNLRVVGDIPDIAFIDYKFDNSDGDGFLLAKSLKEKYPSIINVIITAEESFIDIRRMESEDKNQSVISGWIPKPFRIYDIRKELIALISDKEKNELIASLSSKLDIATKTNLDNIGKIALESGIVYKSEAIKVTIELALKYAKVGVLVLLQGEPGTGKELFAKLISENGTYEKSKYFAVNIAAISEETINSELFGYVKGAFTGANDTRRGYFETYNGGVICLDEINSLSFDLQIKLLRVIENGELIKMGSSEVTKISIQIICSTNEDLDSLVEQKKFRKDLYTRINGFKIEIPPLRERKEDIEILLIHFLNKFNKQYQKEIKYDTKAFECLKQYNYGEGNVRELKNIINKLVMFADSLINIELIKNYNPEVLVTPKTSFDNKNKSIEIEDVNTEYHNITESIRVEIEQRFDLLCEAILIIDKDKNLNFNDKTIVKEYSSIYKSDERKAKYPKLRGASPILRQFNQWFWPTDLKNKENIPKRFRNIWIVMQYHREKYEIFEQLDAFKKAKENYEK